MGITLLLADDSITIQKVVGIIFANEDYELVVVDNGNSALEKAREIRPDVMLVDALMPGKSGYEVCEEVRRDPALRDIPVLLLVGAFEPFDEDMARTCGVDDHITKPFESQNLIDKVKALLELASSRVTAAPAPSEEPPMPEPVDVSEEVTPEIPSVAFEEKVSAEAPGTSARLFGSFTDFVHLGGGDSAPKASDEPSVSEDLPMDREPAAEAEQEGVILLSSVDIVEAEPEDDPWGTLSEVFEEGETIHFGEVVEEQDESYGETLDLSDTTDEPDAFIFSDEETSADELTDTISLQDDEPLVSDETGVFSEEEFSFEEEKQPVWEDFEEEEVSSVSLGESISLGDFSPVEEVPDLSEPDLSTEQEGQPEEQVEFSSDQTDLPFAGEEEYVPADEAFAAVEEETQSSAVPASEGVVTLTEEQLASAISRVSREIIEKIAWEVVPDLTESIIREEIRKIKENLGR